MQSWLVAAAVGVSENVKAVEPGGALATRPAAVPAPMCGISRDQCAFSHTPGARFLHKRGREPIAKAEPRQSRGSRGARSIAAQLPVTSCTGLNRSVPQVQRTRTVRDAALLPKPASTAAAALLMPVLSGGHM